MKTEQQMVAAFMRNAGQAVGETPHLPKDVQAYLGIQLIAEEVEELRQAAYVQKDLTKVYDGLCDLIYVALWLANAAGLDIEEGFSEVHRSNMSKFIDGHRNEETGKWMKGPSYSPPNLAFLIAQQIAKNAQQPDIQQLELPFMPGQVGWPGDGSGLDDLADHNANEADDYRNE
jgi:NTP pyrophosphatase (non-canonical NTP hydrolase)